jgi:hypothetical protein
MVIEKLTIRTETIDGQTIVDTPEIVLCPHGLHRILLEDSEMTDQPRAIREVKMNRKSYL